MTVALVNTTAATMVPGGEPYGLIEDAAIVIDGGVIVGIGPRRSMPVPSRAEVQSLQGRLVTPGLIDCHTHLVFAGDRSAEFERRLSGATYADIAAAGGGIRATVAATRAASADELLTTARLRLERLHRSGATTVEVKSGYGLDLATELRMLQVARRLGSEGAAEVVTTMLAAHVVPVEFRHDPDGYVALIVDEIIPAAVALGVVDAVDAFCEHLAFTPAQVDTIFNAAAGHGLPVKLHAAQLSADEGIDVAVAHDALSADHLEHATDAQVAAMAAAGTVAVLLPGATHTLGETARPPVEAMRRLGVPMALASDCNPGTSPVGDLALVVNLGAVLLGLTVEEALTGVTRHAAAALGLGHDRGTLEAGKRADLAVWDVDRPAEIAYWVGMGLCSAVWVAGEPTFDRHRVA
ncbi:MAG: imidazolonepropionase [Acidimicrobiia bacterium]|nr:imidazolonepropionase [Acidimicrobiia bacterium]